MTKMSYLDTAAKVAVCTAIVAFACVGSADAEPLVTISCDKPNGFSIAYGASFFDRVEASQKTQPEPAPALKGPTKDGYSGTPTFVIGFGAFSARLREAHTGRNPRTGAPSRSEREHFLSSRRERRCARGLIRDPCRQSDARHPHKFAFLRIDASFIS